MEIIKGEDLCGMKFVKDEEGRLVVYEPKGRYIPKVGDEYWYIAVLGVVYCDNNNGEIGDQWVIKHQLVFKTKEECEDYKWFLQQLEEYSCNYSHVEWKDGSIEKYSFSFNHYTNVIETDVSFNCEVCHTCYFTQESINRFREVVGDERIKKYMFDVWE